MRQLCGARPLGAPLVQMRRPQPSAAPPRRLRGAVAPRASVSVQGGPAGGAAPAESSPFDALVAAAPSWASLRAAHATATARSVGQTDAASASLKARALAASRLGPDTAYEVMDSSMDVVAIYSAAYDGSLAACALVVDAHARFLADGLLSGSAKSVAAGYAALAALPPSLRKQTTSGTAAVGAAALLALREDAELLRTMLAFGDASPQGAEADDEARSEAAAAAVLCDAVDLVIAAMPQPEEDAKSTQA